MARPWRRIDRVQIQAGILELRRRGETDFLILLDGRVLMNSRAHRSETALASLACAGLAEQQHPRVLIGGLGMGYTLRAALDALPPAARVTVAELNPAVVRWCREPLASLCDRALDDPRVAVVVDDVARLVAAAARPGAEPFHAILLDLYAGPPTQVNADDPLFGTRALATTRAALTRDGIFGIRCISKPVDNQHRR